MSSMMVHMCVCINVLVRLRLKATCGETIDRYRTVTPCGTGNRIDVRDAC